MKNTLSELCLRGALCAGALCAGHSGAYAAITIPAIIGDNMVVQQQSDARLWGWATPGATVTAYGSWAPSGVASGIAGADGRWELSLPTPEASYTPRQIHISGDGSDLLLDNVLSGEVWFCSGQSNMEMPLRGFWTQPVEGAAEAITLSGRYPGIRVVTVPKSASYTPCDSVGGSWQESRPENAADFTALGYFFARALTDILDVPVGIISCAYGGSKVEGWQSRERLAGYPEWDVDRDAADPSLGEWERISVMYNAMLLPVAGYTVRGFLWNQGESNVGRHATYPSHLADMVADWRTLWGRDDLPFYFVELPGWSYNNPSGTNAAFFRECQHRAAAMIPRSAVVSTSDLVYPYEVNDIHARKKKEIADRLARLAASDTYGIKGMPVGFPTFRSMTVDGSDAVLSFDNASEGFTPNGPLEGFEAAGSDRVFHPASARENPQTLNIELSCPEAGEIKAVRYCFRNFAVGSVFNLMGLPIIPFRTDDWEE